MPEDSLFDVSSSFEEVNEKNSLLGFNVEYLQLKPREYHGRLAGMDVGTSSLIVEDIDVPTQVVGEFQGGTIGIIFCSDTTGDGVYAQKYDFHSSAFLMNLGGELDVITGGRSRFGQLYVDAEMFYRYWEMLAPGVNPFQFGYYGFIGLPPGSGRACYRDISRILRGDYATEQTKEEYVSNVLTVLAEQALYYAPPYDKHSKATTRARILERARDYIEAHSDATIKLPELCAYAGASISTLSRIFKEYYGMAPAAYVRWRRMYDCRQRLQQTDVNEKSVGEIIQACGIRHPGRFASEYRQFFGESPKQTLGYRAE